jgi:hypothetical protein
MAKQLINTATPNSGKGDNLFSAFNKINANFDELYSIGFRGWVFINSNYTAANGDRIIANTSAGPFTVTLPANPQQGDFVEIADGWNFAINNLTLISERPVEGFDEDVVINIHGLSLEFVFVEASWQILTTLGVKGDKGEPGDAADKIVNGDIEVTLSPEGTLTIPGSLVLGTNPATPGSEPLMLDLTMTIHKLSNGEYTLPDGTEGQIIYLVPRPGIEYDDVSIAVAHGRIVSSNVSQDIEGILFYPFDRSISSAVENVITMIFTEGAWQASGGVWNWIE